MAGFPCLGCMPSSDPLSSYDPCSPNPCGKKKIPPYVDPRQLPLFIQTLLCIDCCNCCVNFVTWCIWCKCCDDVYCCWTKDLVNMPEVTTVSPSVANVANAVTADANAVKTATIPKTGTLPKTATLPKTPTVAKATSTPPLPKT